MKKASIISMAIFAIIFVLWGCSSTESLTDFIDDQSALLTKHEREHIIQLNRKLLEELDIHIKVGILKAASPDINQKAIQLFDENALGKKTRRAKGVLFLVDPAGKQVRVEIGYDLEAVFTDGFIGYIERKQMVPFFQAGKVGPGIEATVELLVGKALGTIDSSDYILGQKQTAVGTHYSGGSGARTEVKIGSGITKKQTTPLAHQFDPQPSPQMVLEKYMQILELHIKDPNLELYTPETREFFKKWIVTDAQQDNSLRDLAKTVTQTTVFQHGNLAVIRFPITNRHGAPYFLRRNNKGWMLDFVTMNKTIGFNHKNQWFFRIRNHSFMFGFEDVFFDKNGFPHTAPRGGPQGAVP